MMECYDEKGFGRVVVGARAPSKIPYRRQPAMHDRADSLQTEHGEEQGGSILPCERAPRSWQQLEKFHIGFVKLVSTLQGSADV